MRTAIFLGFIILANAINRISQLKSSDESNTAFALILVVMMAMDLVDFFRKHFKKN